MKKKVILVVVVVVLVLSVSGCMPGDGSYSMEDPANFLSGIWHGWIAPISLIRGFFNNSIRVYEANNTGWWYDLGFYIAVISGFGGISLNRHRKKKKD